MSEWDLVSQDNMKCLKVTNLKEAVWRENKSSDSLLCLHFSNTHYDN